MLFDMRIVCCDDDLAIGKQIEEYLKLYKEGKVKETTLHRIGQTYSSCRKDVLGDMKIQNVRAIHVQTLINALEKKGYSYGTLLLLKSLLGDMFKKAVGNGFIAINPCDAIVLPKKVKYEHMLTLSREYIWVCAYFLNLFSKCVIVDNLTFENCASEMNIFVHRALHIF